MLLVGTTDGLFDVDAGTDALVARPVTSLGPAGDGAVCLLEAQEVVRVGGDGEVTPVGELTTDDGQSVVGLAGGEALVGRRDARLAVVGPTGERELVSFADVPGRDDWENPANPTPDTRSLTQGADGALLVNVHVGGLWRSTDGGASWSGVIEPDADVHQVGAGAGGLVAVAAAVGFGWSEDGGGTWSWLTEGLHAAYCRAVAVDDGTVLVSASHGPFAEDGALYRARPGQPFERCTEGLPEWLDGNIDTGQVSLLGRRAAFGTYDGRLFVSEDGGRRWEQRAAGLAPVTGVRLLAGDA